jgi:hypothetical protein
MIYLILFKPKIIQNKKGEVQVGTSDVEAPNELDEHCCSPAADVLAEIVRRRTGADAAVIDSREAAAPICRGTFTESDVNALVLGGSVYKAELTGAEFKQLLQLCVDCTTVFPVGYIEPYLDYPALAGVRMTMKKDGAVTDVADQSGRSVEDGASFKTAISERVYNALAARGTGLAAKFAKQDDSLTQCVLAWFAAKEPLPQPHCYITVLQEQ